MTGVAIRRRAFLAGSLTTIVAPRLAPAQPARKIPRIGVVSGAAASPDHPVRGLAHGLREAGYVEGQSIVVDYRWADARPERIPGLVAELVDANVDVVVAGNTSAAIAAKKATRRIPIVMVFVSEPVGHGLIDSLGKPGGNVTGMTTFALEMTIKQLELLKEALPKATRFGVLWNPAYAPSADHLKRAQTAAGQLRLLVHPIGVRSADELDAAFVALSQQRAHALLVVADPAFFTHAARLAERAIQHRMPTMYGFREHVEAGGLMAYASDTVDLYRRAAYFVDKILKGANPGDLPVEQPTKFELVINLRTAKALGLTLPQSLLLRADQLIE